MFAFWLFIGSCTQTSDGHNQYNKSQQIIHIKDKQGNHIVKFVWDNDQTLIKTDQSTWKKTAGNSRYEANQNTLLEVQSDGLKITITSKKATWKIRFLDDTMHVEPQKNVQDLAYQVVQKQTDKFWVYHAGHEVGKTKIKNSIIDVDGFGIDLKIPAQTNSYAYALLMMYDVPETIRFTLMAELLAKGL